MKCLNLIGMLIITVLIFCTGCETINTNFNYATGADQLKPDSAELSELQFDDVPVPKDFNLKTSQNESYSFESGDMRSGNLKYIGSGSRANIVNYYKKNMPTRFFGWKEIGHESAGRSDTMTFRKDKYECIITIIEKSGKLELSILMNTI